VKILYLCIDPGIDLTAQSGGAIHIRAFVHALADLGHQVTVVCSTVSSRGDIEADLHATVRPASLAGWNRAVARATQAANWLVGRLGREHPDFVRALHNLRFARIAQAAAREVAPDFIYERYSLWGIAGQWLARTRGTPLVLEVNAPLVYEQQHYRGLAFSTLARRIERLIWQRADLVFVVSEVLRRHLENAGVPAERVLVLPNAVDPSLFRADVDATPLRRRLKLEGRFVVGFVGTFKPWHGIDLLASAFRDLRQIDPSMHLLLVGDGPLRPSLEEEVVKAGLREAVTFTGHVPHKEMPQYLAAMDVALAPYPALDELYYSPLKLFEYMVTGRAVVASRAGQVAELVVDGETGLLFEPGDRRGLVECVLRLRRDATLRQELGRRASEACRACTWSSNAARVVHWAELFMKQEKPLTGLREKEQRIA
jgi:glycosyltransferase involved in cell wall biosynthesis